MLFKNFSSYLQKLELTSSRLAMTGILARLFKNCSENEIGAVCFLACGRLVPKYEGLEFNLAEKLMLKSIAQACNKPVGVIKDYYQKKGDLGEVIFIFKTKNKFFNKAKSNDEVVDIYAKLKEIAQESGEGSVERKIEKMAYLLKKLDPLSAKYIVRISLNKLRLGFSEMTILDALSWMKTKNKSLRPQLEKAFNVLANIGEIAKIFKTKGLEGIKKIKSQPGIPIRAALAERLKTPEEILKKMGGRCALEPKYDGFRVQIHFDKSKTLSKANKRETLNLFKGEEGQGLVQIFSRNMENMTYMFPEITKAVRNLKVDSLILDGEAIAYDPQTKKFLDFQNTVQRKRKYQVKEKAREVPLKVFLFDLLYFKGRSFLNEPFIERRRKLEEIFSKHKSNVLLLTEQFIVSHKNDFDLFFQKAIKQKWEGLMAKKLEAVYQAGARNFNWVKYKAGMQSEFADSLDCVVMGYYQGRGKRSDFGIGAFLAGIKDKDKFLTISKIGTGLSDKQWRLMYEKCQRIRIFPQKKPKNYLVNENLYPDVWCMPELVVEIEADAITKSPLHTAGLALRFPRLKKFREDKDINQITTLKELKKML